MKNPTLKKSLLALLLLASLGQIIAQTAFTNDEYAKALWMTTRFYGAQRSGENNWTVYDHLPAGMDESKRGKSHMGDNDGGYDLSGGWHDCGDHVKFGQTQFYSGYMLLKGYAEFPEGYNDFYSFDYVGYGDAGDFTWEGGQGEPNGIPDILDEVKHATDYFIKCAKDNNTFYYQVGDGNADHAEWVTSVKMTDNPVNKGGDPRPSEKNPNGAAMSSMCSATLALMSRMYRPFDAEYADLCLQHATYAYNYSSGKSGAVGGGSFYGANDNWKNPWAICLSEMYLATEDESYKTTALNLSVGVSTGDVKTNAGYTFDYSNNGELALYTLSQIGYTAAGTAFDSRITDHFMANGSYNGSGVYNKGGSWGKLRYVGNAAFLVALYNKKNGSTQLDAKVYDNIEYVMGSNSSNLSFIVGFGANSPQQPHHRNVYLIDNNPGNSVVLTIPTKNKQLGAMVGGALTPGSYSDLRDDYVNTEVCIDYNAGLVGALGAINAEKNPVDPESFGGACSKPDLGEDVSLCGTGSVTLNAGLPTNGQRTFEWFKDGVSQGSPSTTNNTLSVTQGGTWKVEVDSIGECSKTAKIEVLDILPAIDLGEDVELCSPATVTLDAGVSGSGITYAWALNGSTILGEDNATLTVTSAGNYQATIAASGCGTQSDMITITSILPEVQGDIFCIPHNPNAQLQVLSNGGPFAWYNTPTGGTPIFEGDFFEATPNETTTYYVKDEGTFEGSVGPTATSGTTNNWGDQEYSDGYYLEFDLTKSFNITALSIPYGSIYNDQTSTVGIEIFTTAGVSVGTFTSDNKTLTTGDGDSMIEFTFSDFYIDASWGNTLRMALNKSATTVNGQLGWQQNGSYSYPFTTPSDVVTITGAATGGQSGTNYVYFYDWQISSGASCDRVAVTATMTCAVGTADQTKVELAQLFPNPSAHSATLLAKNTSNASVKIFTLTGKLISEQTLTHQLEIGNNLSSGVYLIEILKDNQIQTIRFLKE